MPPEHLHDLNRIKVSQDFLLSEYACPGPGGSGSCCGYSVKLHPKLKECTQRLRDRTGCRIIIESGHRCIQYNKALGGKHHSDNPLDEQNSFHCQGMADDLKSPDMHKRDLAVAALDIFPRVGLYYGRSGELILHCDVANPAETGLPAKFGDAWTGWRPESAQEAVGRRA